MKKYLAYSICALLLTSAVEVSAQTSDKRHFQRADAAGEVSPELVAVLAHSELLVSQGEEFLKQGNYQAAEKSYREALTVARSSATGIDPSANRGLAEALAAQGKTMQADQVYRDLIYQEPLKWSSVAQENRTTMSFAIFLSKIGQWPEAVAVYEKALPDTTHWGDAPKIDVHFDPQFPMPAQLQALAHVAIGAEYFGHGNNKSAFSEYEKAVRSDPNSGFANYYYGYGWSHLDPKDKLRVLNTQQAKAALQKAVKIGNADIKKAATKALKDAG